MKIMLEINARYQKSPLELSLMIFVPEMLITLGRRLIAYTALFPFDCESLFLSLSSLLPMHNSGFLAAEKRSIYRLNRVS